MGGGGKLSPNDNLPPLVLPVDPATIQAARAPSAALPPMVLPVNPAALLRPDAASPDTLPPLILPVGPPALPVVTAPRPPHPNFWWSLLWCFGFLLFTQIIPGFFIALVFVVVLLGKADSARSLERFQGPRGLDELKNLLLPSALAASVSCGILMSWIVIRIIVGRDWKRRLAVRLPSVSHVVLPLLGLPGAMVLGDIIHHFASQALPGVKDWGMDDITEVMKQISEWPVWLAVLLVAVGPALGEELWCRGFLGRGLVGNYGPVAGVILTSIFFGLLHIDPPHAVAACTLGLVLHFVYLTTRSLLMPMLLHFLNNSLAVLGSSAAAADWPPLDALDKATKNNWQLVGAAALVLLVAVGYALYSSRARLVPQGDATWRPYFAGVDYPPAGSGMVVARPAPTALAWLSAIGGAAVFVGVVYVACQKPV
jgi:membrane protease YdiL (CAAX protease family)